MTDNNGWTGKPGVPLNPEKSRWHWVNSTPREWVVFHDGGSWRLAGSDYRPHEWAHRVYQGPCLTPAEVDARIATARKDALEEAARRAAKIVAERNKLIGILQLAVEQSGGMDKDPAWFDAACRILNAGFTRAVKGEGDDPPAA
jgi:hypothetical protein